MAGIYEGTLTSSGVTIDYGTSGGIEGLRCYTNSPSGRRYLADEAPGLAEQILTVWGGKPTLDEPAFESIEAPSIPPDDARMAQLEQQMTDTQLAIAEMYETMLNTASTGGGGPANGEDIRGANQ